MAVAVSETATAVRFAPRRFTHVNMWVRDLDESMAFYNKVCGVGAQAIEPDLKAGFLTNGSTHHDMGLVQITRGEIRKGRDGQNQIEAGVGIAPGLFHLGWEMENEADLVAAIKRHWDAGLPYDSCVDHQVSRSIYLPDPDGNLNEFYADSMKDWQGWFQGELELITGVWKPGTPAPSTEVKYDPDPAITTVPEAPVHPLRITHAAFATRNLRKMSEFYQDVGGLDVRYESRDGKVVCLHGTASGYDLAICEVPEGAPTGIHHFGFVLADETAVKIAEANVREAGYSPISIDNDMKRGFFIQSPDGCWVEFAVARGSDFAALDRDAKQRLFLV